MTENYKTYSKCYKTTKQKTTRVPPLRDRSYGGAKTLLQGRETVLGSKTSLAKHNNLTSEVERIEVREEGRANRREASAEGEERVGRKERERDGSENLAGRRILVEEEEEEEMRVVEEDAIEEATKLLLP
ncbi:hypothetical protein F2Q69_00007832 [Brassica cretica]|uniref:Uncharacterized protein n=1 Tax=Brassica cretica TaxID=69181 RepID=A0A8S9NVT4_BRACR|nr:hypothetical protein F2Q69_00007832 [Brassica cretica]